LAGDRIGDARDYFVMGRSSRTRRAYDRLRNTLYRCVTLYLYGNLTRVLELSRNLGDEAEYSGFREYQLFSGFLEARTQFELGRYEEASQRLEQLLTVASCYGRREAMSTLRRWLARTEIYLGDAEGAIRALRGDVGGPETWLFLTEAYEHGEHYVEALECARAGLECSHPTVIRSTETALWQTGFAGIEDTVGRNRLIVYRLLDTLHAYLRALVTSEREEALGELHRFTRSRRVGESDPYNPMYFYLYSALLRKGDPEAPDDKLTVLGKAVRFLQDRASRIDDYSDKVAFLHQNYWNRRLVDTARGENLFN
jgi:tetratricopeptide (TPR) repeat protein